MAMTLKAYSIAGVTVGGLCLAVAGLSLFILNVQPQVQTGSIDSIQLGTIVGPPAAISTADSDLAETRIELIDFRNSFQAVSQQVEADDIAPTLQDLVPRTIIESRIASALHDTTEVNFVDSPLKDCLDYLSERNQVEFWIDARSVEEEGISVDQPVTLAKSALQLRTVLNLLLDPLGLTFVVANEMVVITTKQVADATFETRVYDVSKIAKEIPTKELVELVVGAGTDRKWKTVDSEGGSIFATKTALIIRQSYPGHEEILRLLIQLDRLVTRNGKKPKEPENASAVPAKSI